MGQRGQRQRTPLQREKDLMEIARRYLMGETQAIIGAALGLSQSAVSRDIQHLREQWRRAALLDIEELTARELTRIDMLEREYWLAWERSKSEQTSRTQLIAPGADGEEARVLQVTIHTESRVGDPRFLRGVERCIELRCQILGLYAPVKAASTTPDGKQPAPMGIAFYLPRPQELLQN